MQQYKSRIAEAHRQWTQCLAEQEARLKAEPGLRGGLIRGRPDPCAAEHAEYLRLMQEHSDLLDKWNREHLGDGAGSPKGAPAGLGEVGPFADAGVAGQLQELVRAVAELGHKVDGWLDKAHAAVGAAERATDLLARVEGIADQLKELDTLGSLLERATKAVSVNLGDEAGISLGYRPIPATGVTPDGSDLKGRLEGRAIEETGEAAGKVAVAGVEVRLYDDCKWITGGRSDPGQGGLYTVCDIEPGVYEVRTLGWGYVTSASSTSPSDPASGPC